MVTVVYVLYKRTLNYEFKDISGHSLYFATVCRDRLVC